MLKILTKHAKLDVVFTSASRHPSSHVHPRLLAELVMIKLTAASVSQICISTSHRPHTHVSILNLFEAV